VPRFTRAELASYRGAEVPDLVAPGTRLVFVGINPGLLTAARQIHFGNASNRFRPALVAAGILDPPADGVPGMTMDDLATLSARGIGITNLVPFATARADELTGPSWSPVAPGSRPSSSSIARASSRCSASRPTARPSAFPTPRRDGRPSRSGPPSSGWCPTRAD
jgi:TDG/mug DNA glycosylase family protein